MLTTGVIILTGLLQWSTVSGVVLNTTNEPVPSAPVEFTNIDTDMVYQTASTLDGSYSIKLPEGTYSVFIPRGSWYNAYKNRIIVNADTKLDITMPDSNTLNTLGEDRISVAADLNNRLTPPEGPMQDTKDLTGLWYRPIANTPTQIHMLPWAESLYQERDDSYYKDNPNARCLPLGSGHNTARVFRILQDSFQVTLLFENDYRTYREVPLDKQHPENINLTWFGHSVGKWEDTTLVVDTVGFNESMWIDRFGHPHTDKLHIIERYRRLDLGHLEVFVTIEDSGAYTDLWTVRGISDLAVNDNIEEYICNENNVDIPHLIGP